MRIHDMQNDTVVDSACLFLTESEARQVLQHLTRMLNKPKLDHGHVESDDDASDLTVCIYNLADLEGFHPRAKEVLLQVPVAPHRPQE